MPRTGDSPGGMLKPRDRRRGPRAYALPALLCLLLVPDAARGVESTECATAMTAVRPVPLPVTAAQLEASRRGVLAAPALAGFHIELVPDAGLAADPTALAAFRRAADQWEAVISSPVSVTINAGLADLGSSQIIGQTRPVMLSTAYTTIRNALVAVHDDIPVVAFMPTVGQFTASLPAGFSLDGTISATKANLKALGFADLDAMFGATDATVTFNSGFDFDFDNRDGVSAGTVDFETSAAHEIGHVLGFVSSVDVVDGTAPHPIKLDPLDLLRFADDTASDPSSPADFSSFPRSLVPGVEAVFDDTSAEFRMSTGRVNGDGRQASHWKDDALTGVFIGLMDPTLRAATIETVSPPDARALELIGWDVDAESLPTPTSTTTSSTSSTSSPVASSTTSSTTSPVGSTTTSSTTSPAAVSTTSSPMSTSTTTTLPPCLTVRCRLDGALHEGTCQGVSIPGSLVRAIERATAVAERVAGQSGRKRRRTLARARRLFDGAARLARSDRKRRRAKLAPGCATAIDDAIHSVVSSLAPGA